MSTTTVQVETRGAVALVTLNRPDSGNTLNIEMAMDLLAAAMTCGRNPAVRAVVLTGAGRQFCFGGDLRGMMSQGAAVDGYLRELTGYLHSAISHFVRMDAPVIAAVNGNRSRRRRGARGHGGSGDLRQELEVQPVVYRSRPDAGCRDFLPVATEHRRQALHGVDVAEPRAHRR